MHDTSNDDDYEEEWIVVLNTKGQYTLSKNQARIVQQAIAQGERGMIMFESFAVSIPYIAEFYRTKRYLKNTKQLPERAQEKEYTPISPEKMAEIRKKVYAKIGKPFKEPNSQKSSQPV